MQKILVIGCGGAGKSTLARKLGACTGIPVLHLDALYWQSGWVEPSREAWATLLETQLVAARWIMDGNYSHTLALRLAACDTVIFLDMPRWLCLGRVLWRALRYRGAVRPDMAAGCPERLDAGFLRFVWSYPQRSRPKVLALLDAQREHKRIVTLRSAAQVRDFLRALQPQAE